MEENRPRRPRPNEFTVSNNEVYAATDVETWQVIEFLMTKLEPVCLEDLDPEDRVCAICYTEFCVSEDVKLSHPAVKTVCGHVFGKLCLIKWLNPLRYWGLTEGAEPLISQIDSESDVDTNTSCPTCRNVFFPMEVAGDDPMESLLTRLWFWDSVYAFAGVARSEKEEYTRKHLWEFVDYCRSINEFEVSPNLKLVYLRRAQRLLVGFAERLKTQALTPLQERLRRNLAKFEEYDLSHMVRYIGTEGRFIYQAYLSAFESGEEGENEEDEDSETEIEEQEDEQDEGDEMDLGKENRMEQDEEDDESDEMEQDEEVDENDEME